MNLKQFLKPDWRKIVIFVILTIILFLVPLGTIDILIFDLFETLNLRGFPLPAYICVEGVSILASPPCEILYPFFIIDLIIWYLLSCLIIWIYDKRKRK